MRAFTSQKGPGKGLLKNKLEKGKVPFNLHAVYEFQPSPASVSILVEVQIKIKEIEDAPYR